ncbi:uncharacterized protein DMAD_01261 [Drosophila madeirensis]|uniref:Uncharacterized protein n=1 Tax=Drosophila madeirensis TaxID=30013 RepID=A0AAU9FZA7_DROMD
MSTNNNDKEPQKQAQPECEVALESGEEKSEKVMPVRKLTLSERIQKAQEEAPRQKRRREEMLITMAEYQRTFEDIRARIKAARELRK